MDKKAAVVAVVHDGKILLGQRTDSKKWCCPGGSVNKDEKFEDAALRELREESGISVKPTQISYVGDMVNGQGDSKVWVKLYEATVSEKPETDSSKDPDKEFCDFKWVDKGDSLPEGMEAHHAERDITTKYGFLSQDLSKASPIFKFPGLGLGDDRRETAIIERPKDGQVSNALSIKTKSMDNADALRAKARLAAASGKTSSSNKPPPLPNRKSPPLANPKPPRDPEKISPFVGGISSVHPGRALSFAFSDKAPEAMHEDLHLMLNRVAAKHGMKGRSALTQHLIDGLEPEEKALVSKLVPDGTNPLVHNEEALAHTISYMNNPQRRVIAAYKQGVSKPSQLTMDKVLNTSDPKYQEYDGAMKKIYHKLVDRARHTKHDGTKFHYDPPVVKSEAELEKGLKEKLAGGMAAIAMATASPAKAEDGPMSPLPTAETMSIAKDNVAEAAKPKKWSPDTLMKEMHPIARMESSMGQNMEHLKHSKGDFHTAFGAVGLKPVTGHEQYLRSKDLKAQYPNLNDPIAFTSEFKTNPDFYNAVAGDHWNWLKKATKGSVERTAFAWRWGIGASKKADDRTILNDSYVKKYMGMKK